MRPDLEKLKTIKQFRQPTNVTEVKSLMGLANQLTNCNPDIAYMGMALRALTQKGMAWQWTDLREEDFRQMKQLLSSSVIVKPFDQQLVCFHFRTE